MITAATALLDVLSVVWGVAWKILKIRVPVPLGILLATALAFQAFAHFDKTRAIHDAVKSRVVELVTGAEKAALEAKLKAAENRALQEKKISEALQREQYAYAKAEERFNDVLANREETRARLQERINALLRSYIQEGANSPCVLTPDLYNDGMQLKPAATGD